MKFKIINKKQIKTIEKYGIEKLNNLEKTQYIVSKWFYDIDFFWNFFLNHRKTKKTPNFHKEIRQKTKENESNCIIVPRWHGKTTALLIDIVHSLCYEVYKSQLYIAPSWLWEESLWKIKNEFETNDLIKIAFGELVPKLDKETKDNYWTKKRKAKELQLLNGERIETLSKGQNIRGKRPVRIIVDDIEENKDVLSQLTLKKTRNWFFTSLFNTLLPNWKIIILWTILSDDCLIKYIKDKKKRNVTEYKAINNWKPLFPDLRSLEDLQKRKQEIWSVLFNQEFMNIPLVYGDTIVKEARLKDRIKLPSEFEEIIMAVDPASSESDIADPTGICIAWRIGDEIFSITSLAAKKSPNKLFNYILELNERYKPDIILYEKNKEVKLLEDLQMRWLPMLWVRASKDKWSRLLSVVWQIEFWNVFFNKNDEDLKYQLSRFPVTPHDDIMDAFVYILLYTQKWRQFNIFLI